MGGRPQFRLLLPPIQIISAACFGGVGLWERYQILNQRIWGDQTLWNSTAAFHVWPRPLRFAVVTNIPAFLAAGIVEWVVRWFGANPPEIAAFAVSVVFVGVLWHKIGSQFDAQLAASTQRPWMILLCFTAFSIAGVFTPGYISYVYYGIMLWVAFTIVIVRRSGRTPSTTAQ